MAKSPISPPVAYPFVVETSGITLLNQEGFGVAGSEINAIRCQGLIFGKCNIASRLLLSCVYFFFLIHTQVAMFLLNEIQESALYNLCKLSIFSLCLVLSM